MDSLNYILLTKKMLIIVTYFKLKCLTENTNYFDTKYDSNLILN